MRRLLLILLVVAALVLGVGGGYVAGGYLDNPVPTASGEAVPLGTVSPSRTPLPVKTPIPSKVPALETGLDYQRHNFTVNPKDYQPVRLSIETPEGWQQTRDAKMPGEVKYLDKLHERGVRVEAVTPAEQKSPKQARTDLVVALKQSQAPENDFRIVSETDGQVEGEDGEQRTVSTLIYTYIPGKTLRYVIVRWVATDPGGLTSIEMSITGLPQDEAGLAEVLETATRTVHEIG